MSSTRNRILFLPLFRRRVTTRSGRNTTRSRNVYERIAANKLVIFSDAKRVNERAGRRRRNGWKHFGVSGYFCRNRSPRLRKRFQPFSCRSGPKVVFVRPRTRLIRSRERSCVSRTGSSSKRYFRAVCNILYFTRSRTRSPKFTYSPLVPRAYIYGNRGVRVY